MANRKQEYEKAYQYYRWLVDTYWEYMSEHDGAKSFRLLQDTSQKVSEAMEKYLKDNNISPDKFAKYAKNKNKKGD